MFGATAAPSTASTGFNFGAAPATPSFGGAAFGSATPSFGQSPQTPAFGATPAQPTFGTPASGNAFTIGGAPASTPNSNRPTSRARRRLRK